MQRRTDRPEKGIFAGLLFLSVGLILLIGNIGVFPVRSLLTTWWPVFLVIIGVKHLILFRGTGAWINALFWIGTGTLFLSSTLGLLGIAVTSMVWPAMLIGFGIFIMVGCGGAACDNQVSDRS